MPSLLYSSLQPHAASAQKAKDAGADISSDLGFQFSEEGGARDRDTAFPVPVIFATKLQNAGLDVGFLLAWNRPHSGDYSLDGVFAWIVRIAPSATLTQ